MEKLPLHFDRKESLTPQDLIEARKISFPKGIQWLHNLFFSWVLEEMVREGDITTFWQADEENPVHRGAGINFWILSNTDDQLAFCVSSTKRKMQKRMWIRDAFTSLHLFTLDPTTGGTKTISDLRKEANTLIKAKLDQLNGNK